MNSNIKYFILTVIWKEGGNKCSLVDIDKAKIAFENGKSMVRDIKGNNVDLQGINAYLGLFQQLKKIGDNYENKLIGFLSHMKDEVGSHARILHDKGEEYLRKIEGPFKNSKLFLDSENLTDLKKLLDEVKKTNVMIVMLSRSYLTRPWCLAELYTAIVNNIPIVSVNVIGARYDFVKGKKFLEIMTEETLEKENSGASKVLKDVGIQNIEEMAKVISKKLPYIIAQEFNANANSTILDAHIKVIMDMILKPMSIENSE